MSSEMLDNDRAIRDLRESIDAIDVQRSALVASWIIATLIKVEAVKYEGREFEAAVDNETAWKLWRPYSTVKLLTARRDRRTDAVGQRKKEIEEEFGQPIPVNQEGRWQSVKHTYIHTIEEESRYNTLTDAQHYTATEWMHNYTEYEHNRAKSRQSLIKGQNTFPNLALPITTETVVQIQQRGRTGFRLPWPLIHRSPTDHRRSA